MPVHEEQAVHVRDAYSVGGPAVQAARSASTLSAKEFAIATARADSCGFVSCPSVETAGLKCIAVGEDNVVKRNTHSTYTRRISLSVQEA